MRRLGVLVLLIAGPAFAQDGGEVPQAVLDLFPAGAESCYAADAAPADMKPGQSLTSLHLYRLFDPDPATETVGFTRDEAITFDRIPGNSNWVKVMARFKDSKQPYHEFVSCSVEPDTPGKVICGVECDGGFFEIARTGEGAKLSFPEGSTGLRLSASCGESEGGDPSRWMSSRDAGGSVDLAKADVAACSAAEAQLRATYKGDPVPLRERIETGGWRCLKRVYDKAHMTKHPRQNVAAMAVAISGPPVTERVPGEYNETRLKVSVSFRLRDGSVHRAENECGAMDHEFACDGGYRLRRRDGGSALLAAGEYDAAGEAPRMLDVVLGEDDRLFRLDASVETDCRVD